MNMSKQGSCVSPLNPNAAEFIPFSLRASSSSSSSSTPPPSNFSSSGKQLLHSNNSTDANDDDFWQHQLPDDITPDFKDHSLSLSPLSLHPTPPQPTSPASTSTTTTTPFFFNHTTLPPTSSLSLSPTTLAPDNISFADDPSSTTPIWHPTKSFNLPPHHHFDSDTDVYPSHFTPTSDSNPLHLLALQFPGFAAESLAEVYYANSCDLNLTVDMLTQLELQVDGVFDQNMNSKTFSAPNLTSMDFPALPVPDNRFNLPKFTGDELEQSVNPYRTSEKDNMFLFKTGSSKGASDFASAVRKLASQNSGLWKYDRNSSADAIVGSSKSSHVLSSSYDIGTGRSAYVDRMLSRGSSRAAPVWLETGDAVANLYSELREEARDHARIRNAYFEQARQAYLIGNKALAKELSVKGQMHNMQMKAAHNKAQESIYRQRNPINNPEGQGVGRTNEKMIDLHGLHVSEAIHVLRHELGILRNAARRLGEQRLHVYICVGTGHHTRGSRTPARLPISVQRYLLEEGLDYTEPQPGLLRVVLY